MIKIDEVDVLAVQRMLAESPTGVKLIDVRSPGEAASGTIPGAENIPLHLLPLRLPDIASDPKIVFFCRTGARSAQACAYLKAQGKGDNALNMSGGVMAWIQGGLAVA